MKPLTATALLLSLTGLSLKAQTINNDTIKREVFSLHAQTTAIYQYKPGFRVPYSGANSLSPIKEQATSLTSTVFAGARLWKGASAFINPELAGGSGISKVLGIADATNGETFRVGSTAPKIYLGRLFFNQLIALTDNKVYQESGQNQLQGYVPEKYIGFTVGKVCLADYFDDNAYSHDPRTQFMNWGLMSNGAWDYPANTRGYIPSFVAEYVSPVNELRFAYSLLPAQANGLSLDWKFAKANSLTLEYVRRYKISGRAGAVRGLAFLTNGRMGNYNEAISFNPSAPVIEDVQRYGNHKYGFGINAEQELTSDLGVFARASWNDGHTQTWAFTEIDQSISLGVSDKGNAWNRKDDTVGFAVVASGISKPHRDYLAQGGYGFMLGDGKLNYGTEEAAEFYYAAALKKGMYLTGGYEYVRNPGYNKDRNGNVNVFSLRFHAEL
nr:carbohydrate porin [uncultured Flavobacterium sp.]